jgi:hypothetical protein
MTGIQTADQRSLTRARHIIHDHQDLPQSQIVALIGSHRRVVWPSLCPACGAPASTRIRVAKIFGRRSLYGHYAYFRFIVRMSIPFCRFCAERHEQLVRPVPSIIGSFFRTPAVLSFLGAVGVAIMLSMVFLQGGEGLSLGARLYALGGIVALVGLGVFITAREARFLRVPPLTDLTSACDFSDNIGHPFGRRRLYAIRNSDFAAAFATANKDRLWTDTIRKRDERISTIVFVLLAVAAVIAWLVRD